MGLDVVELVIEVEERFSIKLPDAGLNHMQTVGDLYRLVLDKLKIPYQPSPLEEVLPHARKRTTVPNTANEVWLYLKAIIVDQLQVDADEVRESASFQNDLGAD